MEMVAKKMIMNSSSNNNEKQINKEVEEDDHDVALPGFRFHPTDEELVGFYLRRKVDKKPLSIELIKQIDIYKYDPWDLPKVGNVGDKEWYFFCVRGRKYRNSIRPNRVTGSGFWKATGIDKPIYSVKEPHDCIGLKKSLVYYCGSAGKGTKTDWMMHEFRLPPNPNTTGSDSPNASYYKVADDNASIIAQEAEVWTLCRIFKRMPSYKKYDNNTNIPTDHNNNSANKYVPSLETTQKKSSSISSLSTTTTPVDDSSSKTCSLETTDYTNTDKSYHVNLELNSDHHHHNHVNPQEVLFSQRNKRSKPVDRDRDCETSSTTINTNTANTRESWFNLGQYNAPQIGLPHHQHQVAPIVLPGSSYQSFSLNPNAADHDFFANGSWDELTSVVQLAVDRNPSQLNDITDKLQQ